MTRTLACCVFVAMMALVVCAADLRNEDSVTYEIKIHDGPTTTSTSIEANTTRVGICSDCTIEVVEVGSMQVSGKQVLVIKDGQLSIEE